MNEEGRKLIPLIGLSYAGIAGMLACARCITMSLSVFFVGLLILMIVASRSRNARRLHPGQTNLGVSGSISGWPPDR